MKKGFDNVKDVVRQFIPTEEELHDFAIWAFGDKVYEYEKSEKFLKAWNSRHGHSLTLIPTDLIKDDVPKMVDLWKGKK